MGTHAQQDFMKFLYFQKKKLWYNIAKGAYYTAPICSERQRGNLHCKWRASPGGAIAKLWHNIAIFYLQERILPYDIAERRNKAGTEKAERNVLEGQDMVYMGIL